MKKTLMLVSILIAAFSTNAQERPEWMILRLEGGAIFSKYKFSDNFVDEFSARNGGNVTYSSTQKIGYSIGVGMGYKPSDKFQILLTPTYSQEGCDYETNEVRNLDVGKGVIKPAYVSFKEQLKVIKIPVVMRWNKGGERFGVSFGAGIGGNILLKGQRDPSFITENGNPIPDKTEILKFGNSRVDNYRNLDMSLILQAGFYIVLNEEATKRLNITFSYENGMRNLQTNARTSFLSAQGIETTGSRQRGVFAITISPELWPSF